MKLTPYLLFLCMLYALTCDAQKNNQVDSLKTIFEESPIDSLRLKACQELLYKMDADSAKAHYYIQQGLQLATKISNQNAIYHFKTEEAYLMIQMGHYESAKVMYKALLESSQLSKNQMVIASCFGYLGTIDFRQAHYKEAISWFTKSLSIYQKLGDQYRVASVLGNIGNVYVRQGDHSKAIDFLTKSLNLYKSQNNQVEAATVLNNIGVIHEMQGNYKKAIALYKEGLKVYQSLNLKRYSAMSYSNIALIHQKQGNSKQAIVFHQKCHNIYKELGDKDGLADSYQNLGAYYKELGLFSKAIVFFKEALTVRKQLGNQVHIANSLHAIGENYLHKYQEDSAYYFFEKAFDICKATNDSKNLHRYYRAIGDWYINQSQFSKALDLYYEVLELSEESHDTLETAKVYHSVAVIHKMQNNIQEALSYEELALKKYQMLRDTLHIAHTKNAIAALFLTTKYYSQAINYSQEALQVYLTLEDSCQFSTSFTTIGQAYIGLQQIDSAYYYFNKAIPQAKKCEKNTVLTSAYISLAKLHDQQEQPTLSFQAYEQALFYAKRSQNRESLKDAAEQLYPIYKAKGELAKAYETLNIYQANKDSLFNEENTRSLIQKELEYTHAQELQQKELEQQQQESALERQEWITYTTIGACLALIALALAIYRNNRNKFKANQLLLQQNQEIEEKNEALISQQEEIEHKNEVLHEQKAKLEHLDHIKSQFFANISHELRTPLTLISSPIQRILQEEKSRLAPKLIQQLGMMERNTKQLKGLVNDIMDLSKLESDKVELHEQEVGVVPFLNRTYANFDSLAKHLSIQYQLTHHLPATLYLKFDPAKVEKVINNLLSNAIKHTPSGGQINVVAAQQASFLQIQVTDTGKGIAAEDLPYIFDRFYQSKQVHTSFQGGTGIGLALAKELSLLMKGQLGVESSLGEGSTFTFCIPYQEVATTHLNIEEDLTNDVVEEISLAHLEVGATRLNKHYKVLIVEDHPDMQAFIRDLLDGQYYTCVANHGKDALTILERESIDLIVSDVMMPEMDGYTLLERLKANERFANIPVVMLTALDEESNKLQALTLGVDDYLTKPFSPEELLARVHNLLLRYEARQSAKKDVFEKVNAPSLPAFEVGSRKVAEEEETPEIAWLKEVETTIRKELENEHFHLSDLADQLHMSERQFQRRMKKLTGLSPKKYQIEVALQQGRALLETRSYGNVSAVAYSIGMSNVSRFSRMYEARFGKKPIEYFSY